MEVRLLGPLDVVEGGRSLAVARTRERALLARLALSANRVVAAEQLAEDLWGDTLPAGAIGALRVHVSRLRKVLREAGVSEVLVTRPPGYLLQLDDDAVDAVRFETLVARARALVAEGDHQAAGEVLREGLALWRGPALADLPEAPFAMAAAIRLEEERLGALEERVEADLACGRHRHLVGELEALTRDHPLRERLWAQRMLVLYRSGRQAEALRAYQDLRWLLREELGVEPSTAPRELEGAILRHEPALDWQAPTRTTARAAPMPSSGGAPPQAASQGELVTFLFTDLVGSTELLDHLGDDAAQQQRRTHFRLLRRALADAGGQEVKSLGDGLMAAFTSPAQAVASAVAMQRAVLQNAEESGMHLGLRVGIHVGEPIQEENDYFGTPVVVAKRLCDAAQGGQILTSEVVRALVGSRRVYAFHRLGQVALKGISELFPVCSVEWGHPTEPPAEQPDALAAERTAVSLMPAALYEHGRGAFVGREDELKALGDAWTQARTGHRRLVMVAGEPGIGKTRLCFETARNVVDQGGLVLYGRCDENPIVPYQPFVEALRQLLATGGVRPPATHRRTTLARLLPELSEQRVELAGIRDEDLETERYRLFEAVASLIIEASSHNPVLFVLDDLHWAATPTMLLLRHLVRSSESAPLLLLGTYRDVELTPVHPLPDLLSGLRREGVGEHIHLGGLSRREVRMLLEARAGHEFHADELSLWEAIWRKAEGNPLFIVEITRQLTEAGRLSVEDGRWVLDPNAVTHLNLPEGVRQVIRRRLARLSETTHLALVSAAVLGREFEFALLAAMTEMEYETLVEAVEEALAARLVIDVERPAITYAFTHALVREALLGELSRPRKMRLHFQAAKAIEDSGGNGAGDDALAERDEELAYHYDQSHDSEKAAYYLWKAGEKNRRLYLNDEALRYFDRALVRWADSGRAAAGRSLGVLVYQGRGDVLRLVGRHDESRAAYCAGLAVVAPDDPVLLAGLERKIAGVDQAQRRYTEALAGYERAVASLESVPNATPAWWHEWIQAHLGQIEVHYWINQTAPMEDITNKIRRAVEEHGTALQRLDFFLGQAMRLFRQRRYANLTDAVALLDHALAAGVEWGFPEKVGFARFARGFTKLWMDDLEGATDDLSAALAIGERTGDVTLQSRCLTYLGVLSRKQGDVEAVSRFVTRTLEVASTGQMLEYLGAASANQAWLAARSGDRALVRDRAGKALALWRQLPIAFALHWLALFPLLEVAVAEQAWSEAQDCVEQLLDPSQQQLPEQLTAALNETRTAALRGEQLASSFRQALAVAREMRFL